MLPFAVLCIILVWPLGKSIERYGYDRNTYTRRALYAYLTGMAIIWIFYLCLNTTDLLLLVIPIAGILINHLFHLFYGQTSNADEIAGRFKATQDVEKAAQEIKRQRQIQLQELYRTGICLKSYDTSAQQFEYQDDCAILERHGIPFAIRHVGITSLMIPNEFCESAARLLGLEFPDASAHNEPM